WNGDAVDLLAKHAKRRDALWIAAGLGDVAGVRRFFNRDGHLNAAAYENRPPFDLLGRGALPAIPDPDERELLGEAMLVAALNGRTNVIEVGIGLGFPIDYDGWGGTSLLRFAIGQKNVEMVATLVRLGADLDKKGEWPHASAREFARMIARNEPNDPAIP